ncbi:EamA family transporter [Moraxella caprae]|nr:EamA family transporter [Moraxella caprae]
MLFSVVLIWGVNFLAMKIGLNDVPPLILGMVRFLLILLPAVFFFKKPNAPWIYLILYGLTISFGQFSLMFLALSRQFPTGLSALILQAQVFLTMLFSCILLKESVKPNHLVGMITAGAGLTLIGVGQYLGTHRLYARLALGVWRGRCDESFGKF